MTTNAKPVHESETKAIESYFCDRRSHGRTTTLIVRATGEKLHEVMGVATRKEAYRSWRFKLNRDAANAVIEGVTAFVMFASERA